MLYNLRTRLPEVEDVREIATDRVLKAANGAAQLAREASERFEDWASEGLDSVRSRPLMWAAASLGMGVLVGGLFAVWQNASRPNGKAASRAVATRAQAKPKRRAPKTRRVRTSSPDA